MPIKIGESLVLYDIKELSNMFKVTELTLRKYINGNKLKGQKIGTKWYVSGDSLKDYFNKSKSLEAENKANIKSRKG